MNATTPVPARARSTLAVALSGTAATLSGNGLSRFAYVPLFPAMVSAGWVTGAEAGFLGALNLGGYLAGVLGAAPLARRIGTRSGLATGMALVIGSCLACAWNGGVAWLAVWRSVAGIAGGVLMALAGPAVQGAVAPDRRGFAGGIVIAGVGAGIVVSALLVPALLTVGVTAAWLGLAAATATLAALAAPAWPATPVGPAARPTGGAACLYLAYGLSAAGLVPHFVYFADLIVRGRGYSAGLASLGWLLFGLSGLVGSILAGRAADRFGAASVLLAGIALQAAALAMALVPRLDAVLLSALMGGTAANSLSTLALARARELAGPAAGGVWVRATATFAVAQAVTGFGFAALFARTGSHETLFATAFAFTLAALGPALVDARRRR